jgi:hypothetical protein
VNGTAGSSGSATYSFNDPVALKEQSYYRIKMTDGTAAKYSKIILLSSGNLDYAIKSLVNPFKDVISFELIAPETGTAKLTLVDGYGRVVKESTISYTYGLNQVRMFNLGALPKGPYLLRIFAGEKTFTKSVIKTN